VVLATFTLPHQAPDRAFGLVDDLLDCYRRLWSGRDRVTPHLAGYVGSVRALEVTHGEHGWHPHLHVLFFFEDEVNLGEVLFHLYTRWARLIEAAGRGTISPRHGVTVQGGEAAADYVAKWGHEPRWTIAEELTKANVKQARSSAGRSPFALLADFAGGDQGAGTLFREFVDAFKGRSQLRWSRSLRKRLGLSVEKSDEELAATVDALDELLGSFHENDWKLIARHELRGAVLEVARLDGWAGVLALLELFKRVDTTDGFCRAELEGSSG